MRASSSAGFLPLRKLRHVLTFSQVLAAPRKLDLFKAGFASAFFCNAHALTTVSGHEKTLLKISFSALR